MSWKMILELLQKNIATTQNINYSKIQPDLEKENQELKDHINFALNNSTLTEIELVAIKYRFGLEGDEPKTLSEIKSIFGYSILYLFLIFVLFLIDKIL